MAVYNNLNNQSTLNSVEFTPVSEGNFVFFHTKPGQDQEAFKKWVTSAEVGQKIIAESTAKGQTVLVTHGDKPKEQMLETIKAHGDDLKLQLPEKKINLWKWRGVMSMIGQPLQFLSGWNKTGKRDYSIIGFAGLNMAANIVNMTFGAQKSDDKHRLSQIKNQLNDELGEKVTTVQELFRVDENRAALRHDPEGPKSAGQKASEFMQRNSVTLGEVGLRYLGGISLVAPVTRWQSAAKILSKDKSLVKALSHVANPDKKTFIAGSFWLAGKTVAFFAKTPDPYNPEPKSTIENIRENYLFKASTLSEMAGATFLAHDRMTNPTRKIKLGNKVYQDYLGGVGGLLFAGAFAMRLNAPYGVKELNMDEVYAHATDTLAKTPPEKLPQLMADTAAYLTEHLKDQNVQFGEIYNKLMADLYRYHHIALDNLGTEPDERRKHLIEQAAATSAEAPMAEKYAAQRKSIAPADIAASSATGNFAERVNQPVDAKTQGVGV